MSQLTDAEIELLELFTGAQEAAHVETRDDGDHIVFYERRYDPDSKKMKTICHSIKQSDLGDIKNAFTHVLWSLPLFADHLLWMLWIREVRFGMEPSLKTGDMLTFVNDAHNLGTVDTPPVEAGAIDWLVEFALDTLLKRRHLRAKYQKRREVSRNGQTEIHRTRVFSLTLAGKKTAKDVNPENDTSAHIEPDIDDPIVNSIMVRGSTRIEYEPWKPFVIGEPDGILVAGCEKHESTITPSKRTKDRITSPSEPVIAEPPSIESKATIADSPHQIHSNPTSQPTVEEEPKPKKPKNTPSLPKKPRKQRSKKYEVPVTDYLTALRTSVLEGYSPQVAVTNLSYKDIARSLVNMDGFKGLKIESIEQKVRRTEAWKNRKKTLEAVYDTVAFRNRHTGNTPYQEVQ